LGDEALSKNDIDRAVGYYEQGIQQAVATAAATDEPSCSLVTEISLRTNLATALSSGGQDEEAATSYQHALLAYKKQIDEIADRTEKQEATSIAAQAAFYLGMVYQDLGQVQDAVDAYTYANVLDPLHWASQANLGAVLHDEVADHRGALVAYNKAYGILTNESVQPTDPPPEPRFILSQLQYRIGLCISHDLTQQKCVLQDDPDTPVDCKELATHAFALAVEYDADNESAKHMLASITADATMKRASNEYVKSLFDDYAANFEHSLVQELGYTGYERLRRGFDRAFDGKPPNFDLAIDAGCGTGLVGEQFRNVTSTLIGVDLSRAIVDQALQKRPGLYDETLVDDVTQVFRDRASKISLIVAGDSYIYFGDLDVLFESMQVGLADNGYAAFTLEDVSKEDEEALAESKPDWRWQLTASGRFAHRKDYVVAAALKHNLELVRYEPLDGFRYEHGVAVRGHLFVVKKAGNIDHQEL
jgi:predicted TPR repeat methyltransferase